MKLINRVSLQLGQASLFISPAFVVFLDLFKMFAAIPSAIQHAHQFVIMGSDCRTAKMQVGEAALPEGSGSV